VLYTGTRPNTSAQYPKVVEKTSDALRMAKANESTILSGYYNAHVGHDTGVWNRLLGQRGETNLNDNGIVLLLCCNNTLCFMNTFFENKVLHKNTWCSE